MWQLWHHTTYVRCDGVSYNSVQQRSESQARIPKFDWYKIKNVQVYNKKDDKY